MENLDIEALKNRYSNESPEDKEKRNKANTITAAVHFGIGIAMVVISLYYEDDDNIGVATHYLKVAGSVMITAGALRMIAIRTPWKFDDKIADCGVPLLDVALFIINIWGSVIVFSAYSTWTYDDDDKDAENYCPWTPFIFAFGHLIATWIFLPLVCCTGCLACCCKMCSKSSSSDNQ